MRSARRAASGTGDGQQDLGFSVIRSGVRIGGYAVRAQILPPHTLEAEAVLTLDVEQGGDRLLVFELSRHLKVRTVEADGQAVEFMQNEALEGTALSRRGNDIVALFFAQPLLTGQKMHLKFAYAGPVLSEAGGGLMYVGARGIWYPNRGAAMAAASLLRETLWSMVSELHSTLDFDYAAYTAENQSRFDAAWAAFRDMC
jgi:hypothetical protein